MNAICILTLALMANEPTPADGTVSVLNREAAVAAPAPASELRGVRLAPWQVRRLNRAADRQELRDERNCRCDCREPKVLLAKPTNCECR